MNKETVFWIVFAILVILVALYIRFYNNQQIGMLIGFNRSASASVVYPYQRITLQIFVKNTGGSLINKLPLQVVTNSNVSTPYQITIPVGKTAVFAFNFTPTQPGQYNVSVVADPGRVYNIMNRADAQNALIFNITPAKASTPYDLLPKGNFSTYGDNDFGPSGFSISGFLFSNYNIVAFAPAGETNDFVSSILNMTLAYIKNISVAYATYRNGDYAYSVWVKGYLLPSAVSAAALGRGLVPRDYTLNGSTITVVSLGDNTTLCAWYDSGWLETVTYHNLSSSCLDIANGTIQTLNAPLSYPDTALRGKLLAQNSTLLANFSSLTNGNLSFADLFMINGTGFVAPRIWSNVNGDRCLGTITMFSNLTYCNSYALPIFGAELVKTTSLIGRYNVSVFSLVNASFDHINRAMATAMLLIRSLNVTGTPQTFVSGFAQSCSFNSSLACQNATFYNNTLEFRLTNRLSRSMKLYSVGCYSSGQFVPTPINKTLDNTGTLNVSTKCYSNGGVVYGLPLDLHLHLQLNYSIANTPYTLQGNATVNIFS